MFRPGLNARCRARLGTGIVAHNNNSVEVWNVQIRGTSEGVQQWPHHKPLSLERSASEATVRAKEALLGVAAPGNLRKQQSGAMLASVPSLCPASSKQTPSNHTSDSYARKSDDMESSAESGGSSESSTMSDGDSVNINNSQYLLRSTSGASMVTSDVEIKERETKALPGSGSILEENEGENEVDVNTRPESPARNSDSDTHSIQREPESAATTWTDDKHSSFLNSMEATFVKSLYSQQGLGHLGVYGNSAQIDDSEQDCVESRPVDAYGCCTSHPTELFELVQGGHQQKSYYRPQGLEPPQATTAVLANPWVRHFKQKIMTSEYGPNHHSACPAEVAAPGKEVSVVDVSQINQTNIERDEIMTDASTKHSDAEEKEQCGASEDIDNKEIQSGVEALEVEQGLRLWQNRLHIGGQTMTNPTSRKDMASWVLKRPPAFEENGDIFVTKRIKSTQQELAQKDLEMLEQYNAKQRVESVQAAVEHSEQAPLEHARKAVEACFEQPGASLASEHKDARKVVGRSAMDQVVPLLGRMDSYESKSSVSFPDLNAPFNLSTGAACATGEPGSEGREKKNLSSVPDLNAPLRILVGSAYTTNQATINFTKDGEAIATAWSPRPEAGSMEERYFQDLAGASYQPYGQGCDDDGSNLSLELQTKCLEAGEAYECEPQLSPMSNSRTWTWGLGGLRRRLHDTVVPAQPSRPLRDGIHFSDPVLFRSSGQQV
ncbi:hypothetical protein KC19_3G068800 [Ceratodon purpureus]|uniref:Uncharacterized protein n=1 Tax=Ceratodon purpureus TaxID=3225 RepID=A0A8T0IJB4_CERPU|nr:hypothetical protein KC19_3G068800 [Ceratodon purpureus]